MAVRYKPGDIAYLVESGRFIREVQIRSIAGGMCLIKFKDTGGGIRIREQRLFTTREEAEKSIPGYEKPFPQRKKNQYDYM